MAVTQQAAAIENARKGYTAFDAGDIATVQQVVADDAVWHSPGKSRFGGEYKGKQAVFELFGRLMQEGVGQQHDIHDILASDDHVVVLSTVTVTFKGRSIKLPVADVIHQNDQGQTREWWRIGESKEFDDLVNS